MPKHQRKSSTLLERLEARNLFAGVTIITHGFNSNVNDFVTTMQNQIAAQVPGGISNVARYTLVVNNNSGPVAVESLAPDPGSPTFAGTTSGEIIIKLDWSDVASVSPVVSTVAVGDVVADYLLSSVSFPWLQAPVHLIGHSRGASLNTEIAKKFAQRGVWTDQITNLDPHPVDGINEILNANFGDAAMNVWSTVTFADTYYRTNNNPFDFSGEPVAGAHNVLLTEGVLDAPNGDDNVSNGNPQDPGYGIEHSDVHLWYHGTIGASGNYANSDGSASVGPNWYSSPHPSRDQSGFYFSRINGGARPADGLWSAYGGSGSRIAVAPVGTQWANIGRITLGNPSTTISTSDQLALSYSYQDLDSPATITWYTDTDANPYDGYSQQLTQQQTLAATSVASSGSYLGSLNGIIAGTRHLFAKIQDAVGHLRYDYLPGTITFSPPPVSVIAADSGYDATVGKIKIRFSNDVLASLEAGDLTLQPLPTGTPFSPTSFTYDSPTNTATFSFTGLVPDGDYHATLPANTVTAGGGPLATDYAFDFFQLNGDANHDRKVDIADLAILATNYQTTGKIFNQADFNYDGQVDAADLGILSANWTKNLSPPMAAQIASLPSRRTPSRVGRLAL